ncbi:PAAR domain-containing protein [Polyangium mundeleinium]|uniref:PAAR domain-containing protein n=1 Tax=Polyangium mundeleinium TaxID=2995306 RepID=A0ABT5ENX5_9BACT|nr:PAAR domain-containing protein [Polyangium mundeleinium]MDC0743047.1 PAAR domain-containing protein [Polyangium mundeleinium]
MAQVARKGIDECSGHDGCPPRKAIEGSPDVFLDGHAIVRVGDLWEPHDGPDHPHHDSVAEEGSDEIYVNGKAVVRVGDCLDCGSVVKTGSMALFAGGKKIPKKTPGEAEDRPNRAERQNKILLKMKPGKMPRASVEAPMDRARAQKLVPLAKKLGAKYGIPPALLLGLASRESGFGRHLRADGYGKYDPDGYGMFQVDKEFHKPKGGPFSMDHAEQAMRIWSDTYKSVKAAHPSWTREQLLAGSIAGYNFGSGNVRTQPRDTTSWAKLDDGSAGDDYSRDVWARARYFSKRLKWD